MDTEEEKKFNVVDDLPPLPRGDVGNESDITEVYGEPKPNVRTCSMSESEDEEEEKSSDEEYVPRAKLRSTPRARVAK